MRRHFHTGLSSWRMRSSRSHPVRRRRKAATMRDQYLLAGSAVELERLRLQARVWEPEAEAMRDRIGVPSGAHGIDIGCGTMGILGPLSRRAGPAGQGPGSDTDAMPLA